MPLVNSMFPLDTLPGEPQSTTARVCNDMNVLRINFRGTFQTLCIVVFPAADILTLAHCCIVVISVSVTRRCPHFVSFTSQFIWSPEVVSNVTGVIGCGQVCGACKAHLSIEESWRRAAVTD